MIFNRLKHFSQSENWGDWQKINGNLLFLLDGLTDYIKQETWKEKKKVPLCIIHNAYAKNGHSPHSQHYKGNAVDFHFANIDPLKALGLMERYLKDNQMWDFIGLGVYPQWKNAGFHIDVRGYKARWSKVNGLYTDIDEGVAMLESTQLV